MNTGTDHFKTAIQTYLDNHSNENAEFAEMYKKENKNIDDCCKYIINTVKATGHAGFEDEEIFTFARDYYIKDDVNIDDPRKCNIVTNYHIEITEERKAELRQEAEHEIINEQKKLMKGTSKPIEVKKPEKEEQEEQQLSLFS